MNDLENNALGIEFDLVVDELEPQWEDLVSEIIKGNVIPVIGPDFLISDSRNLHSQIIDFLAQKLRIDSHPQTFSQLIYDKSFTIKRNKIYNFVNQVVNAVGTSKQPNALLMQLLQTKRFPFVITTSFTPIVEQAMAKVWGKEPRVLVFKNDPNNDKVAGKGDIKNARDLEDPTVYYMFGKHCNCDMHPDFVVTELDMMQFCQRWISGVGTPPVLSNIIKDKYLLVLGNNYSDWLLRFIWYSLRSNEKLSSSLFVGEQKDEPLMSFLSRLEVFTQTDPRKVVEEICGRLQKREQEMDRARNVQQEYSRDVFLSYSRRDSDVAVKIMKKLSEQGVSVWMDSEGGIGDAERWRDAIARGVRECRIFVPLLTANIEREFAEEHEYRIEWNLASTRASKMGNVPYIFPLAEKGFDFYNELTGIPKEFGELNAVWYDSGSDLDAIAGKISDKVQTSKSYTAK